jgi:hypothetical protein
MAHDPLVLDVEQHDLTGPGLPQLLDYLERFLGTLREIGGVEHPLEHLPTDPATLDMPEFPDDFELVEEHRDARTAYDLVGCAP